MKENLRHCEMRILNSYADMTTSFWLLICSKLWIILELSTSIIVWTTKHTINSSQCLLLNNAAGESFYYLVLLRKVSNDSCMSSVPRQFCEKCLLVQSCMMIGFIWHLIPFRNADGIIQLGVGCQTSVKINYDSHFFLINLY